MLGGTRLGRKGIAIVLDSSTSTRTVFRIRTPSDYCLSVGFTVVVSS